MNIAAEDWANGVFQKLFRSDDLFDYKRLCAGFTSKPELVNKMVRVPDSVPVVVDSSQVIHQILWAVRKKRQPEARTDLAEVLDSGVITAYAPEQLRQEVESKIPILAAEKKLSEEALWGEWRSIEARIVFKTVRNHSAPKGTRDVKDLPFVRLAKRIGALGILTHDRDIPAMGGRTLSTATLKTFRDYARAKAAAVGAFLSMVFWTVLVITVIGPILMFVWSGIVWLSRKIGWVGVLALALSVALIIYLSDDLRCWFKEKYQRFRGWFSAGWDAAAPHAAAMSDDFAREELKARSLWKELSTELGLPPEPSVVAARQLVEPSGVGGAK